MKPWEKIFLNLFLIFLIFVILVDFSSLIKNFIYLPDFLNFDFKLGLDLAGGTILTYQAELSQVENKKETMEMLKDVIERRVNLFGVNEPKVLWSINGNEGRLIVELPGIKSPAEAIKAIGETPYLEFYIPTSSSATTSTTTIDFIPSGLNGKYLVRAQVDYNPTTFEPVVTVKFNDEGAKIFKELTEKYLGQPIAIVLDGKIISTPVVRDVIQNGNAQISGNFSLKDAQILARRLNEGTLPVSMEVVSQQTISGSYGKDFVELIVKSAFYTVLVILIFMTIYYRFNGFIASVALIVYALLNIFVYKIFGIVLTLAGIIGFLLSIGMAIDANVLILERFKEEKKSGKSGLILIQDSFSRAWNAIRDSNITTLISVIILYFLTTSFVRGFALTLGIGVLISMFTAVFFTRILMLKLYVKNENT